MAKKKITLDRDYYSLKQAANYLTKKHGKDYYDTDILDQAIKGNISLCFYHESELGIFEVDNKKTGILKDESLPDILVFEGTSFFFKGYVELPKDMITVSRESTSILELNLLENIDPSNPTLSKSSSQHYCGCIMNYTDGDRDVKFTNVSQKDIRISKDQLEKYSESIDPDIYIEQAHEISALKNKMNNLYKMVLVMAVDKYEYDMESETSDLTGTNSVGFKALIESYDLTIAKDQPKIILEEAKKKYKSKMSIT